MQILNTDFGFYSFSLTVPGLILSEVFLLRELPSALPWPALGRHVRRGFVLHGLLVAATLQIGALKVASLRTLEVKSARGAIRVADRARERCVSRLIGSLGSAPGPKPGLVVFPEGVGINFLAGMQNPLSLLTYLPLDLAPPGAIDSVIRQMELTKPEYVIEVQRNTSGYGKAGFDADYGLPLVEYLERAYSVVSFEPNACLLLERKRGR